MSEPVIEKCSFCDREKKDVYCLCYGKNENITICNHCICACLIAVGKHVKDNLFKWGNYLNFYNSSINIIGAHCVWKNIKVCYRCANPRCDNKAYAYFKAKVVYSTFFEFFRSLFREKCQRWKFILK